MGARVMTRDHCRMIRSPTFILAALVLALSGSVSLGAGSPARGKAIAEKNCQKCHAVGRSGASTNPNSPPFRTLSERYPLKDLEEALGEGIVVGHGGPEMPQFEFEPRQIGDLLAFLRTIQTKRH